uniref:Uncharacterized protein n=1 Tax=Knipowitschia caucasica TaxID=637954 RepID=A0AAV2L4B8_KNICA
MTAPTAPASANDCTNCPRLIHRLSRQLPPPQPITAPTAPASANNCTNGPRLIVDRGRNTRCLHHGPLSWNLQLLLVARTNRCSMHTCPHHASVTDLYRVW